MMSRLPSTAALFTVLFAVSLALLSLQGCESAPGMPKPGPEVPRPDAVLDFPTLYQQNCSACHGANGMNGPSYPLANPEYQALIDTATLRQVISQGRPGTLMPAFAISAGGTLTDRQIDALVSGMRNTWGAHAQAEPQSPPYQSSQMGNAARGSEVYNSHCASCHGSGERGGSISDPDFLALLSNQGLRTIIIAGRPDIGQPDWKGQVPQTAAAAGHAAAAAPLNDQDVTDVIAWLASKRPGAKPPAGATAVLQANPQVNSRGGSK